MRARLLGAAAGGGFPQWNCNCTNCRGARRGTLPARPRSQSCVALSADGRRWFLLNASPDIRTQIEGFPGLHPPDGQRRGTPIEAVLLTNADLDHTLGLLILREGEPLVVHATAATRTSLNEGLRLEAILARYCGVSWREPPATLEPLLLAGGSPSGLLYSAFPLAGRPPRYHGGETVPDDVHSVGYRFVDEATGGRLVFAPDVAALDEAAMCQLQDADAVLVDGTFWQDDELPAAGLGTGTAASMGHLPVGGPGGSLERLCSIRAQHKIYLHINNTNPILVDGSPERIAVEEAGWVVGHDGLEFSL